MPQDRPTLWRTDLGRIGRTRQGLQLLLYAARAILVDHPDMRRRPGAAISEHEPSATPRGPLSAHPPVRRVDYAILVSLHFRTSRQSFSRQRARHPSFYGDFLKGSETANGDSSRSETPTRQSFLTTRSGTAAGSDIRK